MQEIKKNDELLLDIESLGANGEGVAHFNGATIFVQRALPGEQVLAHIILCKKTFYVAKIISIVKPSDDRINPPCPYYEKCGGCDLQHMSYDRQLKFKTDLVGDTLKKYAKLDKTINDTLSFGDEFGYRNKFAFPVASENGTIKIGLYRAFSHNIVEIDKCMLQSKISEKILACFKEFMEVSKLSAYDETSGRGLVKHIVCRESQNSFILTVVVTENKEINFDYLINSLEKLGLKFGLYKNINKLNNNVIFGDLDIHIYGLTELEKNEFGINYFVNNRSFLQVNDSVKTEIYNKILSEINDDDSVIDAYSGAGLLSGIIAKKAKKVVGIEIVKEATKNAEILKNNNNLYNLTNLNGDCSLLLKKQASIFKNDYILVLDPPRKGVTTEVINAILENKPKKIIYLSCNPATLARDISLLKADYSVKYVQPYDMFPQTSNVETLVVMEKNKWQKKRKI